MSIGRRHSDDLIHISSIIYPGTWTDLYPNYSGADNAEKLRNFIIGKADSGACYVLLVGNMDYVPVRYAIADYITDLYFAGLEGDWNADNDPYYGEWNDNPDLGADIFVGRVAATPDPIDIETWVDKLVIYVDNPGDGNYSYLANVMIGSADQMADINWDGDIDEPLHIAAGFSNFFDVNTESFREYPSGGDPNPTSPYGSQVVAYLEESTPGIYVNLNHGSPEWYSVLSRGYNNSPWSGVTSCEDEGDQEPGWGYIGDVQYFGRQYIQLSTSCDLGALDCALWYGPVRCFAEQGLLLYGGCVAGTFNSRYGLTPNSSYLERYRVEAICREDFQHILAIAHYATLSAYADIERGLVLNNNFFGDPSMHVWTHDPGFLAVTHPNVAYRDIVQDLTVTVKDSSTHIGLSNVLVTLVKDDEVYGRGFTDVTGRVTIPIRPDTEGMLKIEADRQNFIGYEDSITVDTYCESAVPGDANGSGSCNGLDITFLQSYFYSSGPHPPDSCMCGDNFLYHAADANGNCTLNGLDLTFLVAYFKGGPAPQFCPTCNISRFMGNDEPSPSTAIKNEEIAH
jgi:hypothetical protein